MLHRSLVREISIMLAFKAAALFVLYFLFFGPDARPNVTAGVVSHSLLTAPAANQGEQRHD